MLQLRYHGVSLIVLSQILVLAWTSEAQAQMGNVNPGLPGSILQDVQQKTLPNPLQSDNQREKPPEATIEGVQEQPSQAGDEQEELATKVFIREINIEGCTLLSEKEIAAAIAPYENRENTFSDVQSLAASLTDLYYQKGYVTSRIYIPPQKIEEGILTLAALEGRLGTIEITEGRYFKARSVKHGISIKEGDPLNINSLRRNILALNENPDRGVRVLLKPGERTGESDLQLEIIDRFPLHVTPSFDNLGRHTIGDNRLGLQISNNNLLGFGDMLTSSASFTRRSFSLASQYQMPVGSHGTIIGFEQALSKLHMGESVRALDIEGNSSTYSPFIKQPLFSREQQKLTLEIAFDFKQMDTDILQSDFSRDQLRVLRPTLHFEEYDRWGRIFMQHEIGLGLDLFSGTDGFSGSPSRLGAGSKFFRYTGSIVRTQRLPFSTFGIFRLSGQLTPDRLVSAEQFQVGGAFSVRGYKEGQVSGDNGMLVSAEWRVPFFLTPKPWKIPFTQLTIRDNVQMSAFLDYGSVHINKPATGVDRSEYLLGGGIGFRFNLGKYLTARIDIGFPMLNQPDDDSGPRVHFGFSNAIL